MLSEVKEYLDRLSKKDYTFLTLSGKTEIGKTLLLKEAHRFILEHAWLFRFKNKDDPYIIKATLKELVSMCLGDNKYIRKIKGCGIVLIEEFLSQDFTIINTYNAIVVETAFDILNLRDGKPIIMDTNKSIGDIDKIDVRIHSRLFRNNGMVLDIPNTVTPYLLRK